MQPKTPEPASQEMPPEAAGPRKKVALVVDDEVDRGGTMAGAAVATSIALAPRTAPMVRRIMRAFLGNGGAPGRQLPLRGIGLVWDVASMLVNACGC